MLWPTPDGKAIWRATVTSSTGWSHSFTLLRLAPALIWEPRERPAPFTGTVSIDAAATAKEADVSATIPPAEAQSASEGQEVPPWEKGNSSPSTEGEPLPDAMEDMLSMVGMGDSPATRQDAEALSELVSAARTEAPPLTTPQRSSPAPTPRTTQPSGEHFIAWLKQGIASRRLIINDAKALVHTVSGTAYLVSPGVFQRYAQEHPQVDALARQEEQQDWQWVQKRFEKLQLHVKHPNGLNIWTCEVTGPRKSRRLHGYLLEDSSLLFPETPPSNPYLCLLGDTKHGDETSGR